MSRDINNFFRELILNNYFIMIKRKNIQEIMEFMNDAERMQSLLWALGASKEVLELPAHREKIEECLKYMIKSIIDAIRDEDMGFEVEYVDNGLKVNTESLKIEESTILQFCEDSYQFDKKCNIGEVSKKVKGIISKRVIGTYTCNRNFLSLSNTETLYETVLDQAGFVINENMKSTDGRKKSLIRNGLKITCGGNNKIKWDGSPSKLNAEDVSSTSFCNNLADTISKYPTTQEYYESIVGNELVEKICELRREKS